MSRKFHLDRETLNRQFGFQYAEAAKQKGSLANRLPALYPLRALPRRTESMSRQIRSETAPLSFAQQRLWFLSQLDPHGFAYHQASAMRLTGALDVHALKRALTTLVGRQGALRTRFVLAEEGIPIQSVSKKPRVDLPIVDLSETAEPLRDNELQRALIKFTRLPFKLSEEFPFRAVLIRLGAAEHVLLVVIHEIACDCWSNEIIWREISTLYRAFHQGKPSPLGDLPMQYADYALAERQQLDAKTLETDLSYWKKQLADIRLLELPTDRARPAVQTLNGAKRSLLFSPALGDELRALSRSLGVNLYTILLAAFQVLLYRFTGQDDIAVGSPTNTRRGSQLENLVGVLENTLVLRTDLSGNPSFRELLGRVNAVVADGLQHRSLPFEKLVEEIAPERDLSHTPLFQAAFAFAELPETGSELPGILTGPIEIGTDTAKFDLALHIWDQAGALKAELEYNVDLFDDSTIERMLGHFQALLEGLAGDPQQKVGNAAILTEPEKCQLIKEWNATRREYPREKCIHQLFEEQAERTPDATALVFGGEQLSYRELNCRVNQLAYYLRSLGVRPNTLVAISLERCIDMVVAVYGTLKAGAAYVPIDPDYPKDRLDYMLESAHTAVLLTQSKFMPRWKNCRAKVVCIDSDWAKIAAHETENPVPFSRPRDLIYVIFTSGSTGRPKAAGVYHRGFVNLLQWFTDTFSITASDRALVVSSLSFDLTQKNLYAALIRGGQIHLLPGNTYDPAEIAHIIDEQRITLVNCTPSAFYPLVEQEAPESYEKLRTLRTVFLGGEPISIARLRPWFESPACRCEIANTYGPTECTDICAFYRLTSANMNAYPFVPTGKAVFNTQLLVLNKDLGLCPAGVVGELCVAGDGVGAGYINDPELTALKFVPASFPEVSSERIYRTNDLVRYLPDGNLEFIGRADNQVKLRGFRIEPGEIETVLSRHPAVREAAVTVREDAPGDRRLVAYIVAKNGQVPSKQLRGYVAEKLPPYMVPSAFITIEKFPLTPNGKVDRRALPPPHPSRVESDEAAVAPRTRAEKAITKIWTSVLHLDEVSIHDNFFELGGDSLMAVRLMREIENATGKKLPLAALFQAPTIEQLARLVGQDAALPNWESLYPIQPEGSKHPFFWIHGEDSDALLSRYLGPDQPLYGVRHQSEDGNPARYTTVAEIAAYYLTQIRAVQPEGPYYLGGYCFGAMVAFEIAQRLKKLEQHIDLLLFLDPPSPNVPAPSAALARPTSPVLNSGASWMGKIYRHLGALESLSFNKKFDYILQTARSKTKQISVPVVNNFQRLVYKFCLRMGLRLPLGVRPRYVLDIYDRAIAAYVPEVYAGRVIILKAAEDCEPEKWKALATAGIEIHAITGDHSSVLKEPYVGSWGAVLKSEITKAQSQGQPSGKPYRSHDIDAH